MIVSRISICWRIQYNSSFVPLQWPSVDGRFHRPPQEYLCHYSKNSVLLIITPELRHLCDGSTIGGPIGPKVRYCYCRLFRTRYRQNYKLTYRGIRKIFYGIAGSTVYGMGRIGTVATDIFSVARGIDMRTESISWLLRTRYVWEAGIVGNAIGIVPNKVIGSNGRATMTASSKAATI